MLLIVCVQKGIRDFSSQTSSIPFPVFPASVSGSILCQIIYARNPRLYFFLYFHVSSRAFCYWVLWILLSKYPSPLSPSVLCWSCSTIICCSQIPFQADWSISPISAHSPTTLGILSSIQIYSHVSARIIFAKCRSDDLFHYSKPFMIPHCY